MTAAACSRRHARFGSRRSCCSSSAAMRSLACSAILAAPSSPPLKPPPRRCAQPRTLKDQVMRRLLAALAFATVATFGAAAPAYADHAPVYTGLLSRVAVSGYDPVAYFTDGRPV